MDIIWQDTPIKEARAILDNHRIAMPMFWEIALGMLLSECDHLEVHGFGTRAYFVKVQEE